MLQSSAPDTNKIISKTPRRTSDDPFYSNIMRININNRSKDSSQVPKVQKITPTRNSRENNIRIIQNPNKTDHTPRKPSNTPRNCIESTTQIISGNFTERKQSEKIKRADNMQFRNNLTNLRNFKSNFSESSPNQNLKIKHIMAPQNSRLKNYQQINAQIMGSYVDTRMSFQSKLYNQKENVTKRARSKISDIDSISHSMVDKLLNAEEQSVSTIENIAIENGLSKFYRTPIKEQRITSSFVEKTNSQKNKENLSHRNYQTPQRNMDRSMSEVNSKKSPINNRFSRAKDDKDSRSSLRSNNSVRPKFAVSPRVGYYKRAKVLGQFSNGTDLSNIYMSDSRIDNVEMGDMSASKRTVNNQRSNQSSKKLLQNSLVLKNDSKK